MLLGHDGTIKLADFGASRRIAVKQSGQAVIKGTPLWMAPEVLRETRDLEKRCASRPLADGRAGLRTHATAGVAPGYGGTEGVQTA